MSVQTHQLTQLWIKLMPYSHLLDKHAICYLVHVCGVTTWTERRPNITICNSIILAQYVRQMRGLDSLVCRQTNTNMSNNKSYRHTNNLSHSISKKLSASFCRSDWVWQLGGIKSNITSQTRSGKGNIFDYILSRFLKIING